MVAKVYPVSGEAVLTPNPSNRFDSNRFDDANMPQPGMQSSLQFRPGIHPPPPAAAPEHPEKARDRQLTGRVWGAQNCRLTRRPRGRLQAQAGLDPTAQVAADHMIASPASGRGRGPIPPTAREPRR